jgi:subtilisin family serine protease
MQRTTGRTEIKIGLIDGPVVMDHPDLAGQNIQVVSAKAAGACFGAISIACTHGTFVAGMLAAKRGSSAPAICPNCTLLVRPIFPESASAAGEMPSASPEELASAIVETVNAGAHLINLSAATAQPSAQGEREIDRALGYAARRGVIVIAAAGNHGSLGSSAITSHPCRKVGQSYFPRYIGSERLRF